MRGRRHRLAGGWIGAALATAALAVLVAAPPAQSAAPGARSAAPVMSAPTSGPDRVWPQVSAAVAYGLSAPLGDPPSRQAPPTSGATSPAPGATSPTPRVIEVPNPDPPPQAPRHPGQLPGALQGPGDRVAATGTAPAVRQSFEGLGEGFVGPQGTFTPDVVPPDANGDVGPNHYVQVVNAAVAVFSKTGVVIRGPVQINSLFATFGGLCETQNSGDPIVNYDSMADRWVISQFAVQTGGPDYECIAVSRTSDPAGRYALYAFEYAEMNDYPKIGVWPDGYYATYNMYDATTNRFRNAKACAFDRAAMLAGASQATQQCFNFDDFSYLPSDLDGPTLPPPGSPNYVVGQDSGLDGLRIYQFHVDWTNPARSTFTGPAKIPLAPFNNACANRVRGRCVVQPGLPNLFRPLEALAGRTMYRLAYRNYGDHESLVTNMSIAATADVDGQTAPRWFEIRSPRSASPVVHQQGTYAPDTTFRWMGSVAMDRDQNLALGYSRSSSVVSPDIAYTGRLATDPLGLLQAESVVPLPSTAGQFHSRWGDYTSMQVDPLDDCTFWYTNQYQPVNGVANWHTRIVSFKFPSCLVPQTVVFPAPPTTSLRVGTVQLHASATSGLPVRYVSATPRVCRVTGTTARLVAAGTCTVAANQAGNDMYGPAAQVVRSFAVTPLTQQPANGCVTPPRSVPVAGVARLTKPDCLTNAGLRVRVSAACESRQRGDIVQCRLLRDRRGAWSLRTFGQRLWVSITWSAPAGGNYSAYRQTRQYAT